MEKSEHSIKSIEFQSKKQTRVERIDEGMGSPRVIIPLNHQLNFAQQSYHLKNYNNNKENCYISPSSRDENSFSVNVLTGEELLLKCNNSFSDSLLLSDDEEENYSPPRNDRFSFEQQDIIRTEDRSSLPILPPGKVSSDDISSCAKSINDDGVQKESVATLSLKGALSFDNGVTICRSDETDSYSDENGYIEKRIVRMKRYDRSARIRYKIFRILLLIILVTAIFLSISIIVRKEGPTGELKQSYVNQISANSTQSPSITSTINSTTIESINLSSVGILMSEVTSSPKTMKMKPSSSPINHQSIVPSEYPSPVPSKSKTTIPTGNPSRALSFKPSSSFAPSTSPTLSPTLYHSEIPSFIPTSSKLPSISKMPTSKPSNLPSLIPTQPPSTHIPTSNPSNQNLLPLLNFPK